MSLLIIIKIKMIKRGKTFNFETGREDDPSNVIQTEIFESTDKDVDFD